jgi:hypothetical protein
VRGHLAPEMCCGRNICAWSIMPLLGSETEGIESKTDSPVKVGQICPRETGMYSGLEPLSSVGAKKAESGVKGHQMYRFSAL